MQENQKAMTHGAAQGEARQRALDDCFVPTAPRLSHDEALAILKARLTPIVGAEKIPIEQACGRALAEIVDATANVPGHTNAAVDGYAFAHSDYDRTAGALLPVAARAAAGRPLEGAIRPLHAVRIFTGALLPPGVDTVAMQEDCRPDGEHHVFIPGGLKAGSNVRRAGEDLSAGTRLFDVGHRLRPQDVAALASVGVAEVAVFKKLRVGVLSTGDEVVPLGQPLRPGQVYDANAPLLAALLEGAGCDVVPLGIAPDNADTLDATLRSATTRVDVIVASGGASKGEEDHMVQAFERLGERHLWQLAIKPGRPLSFGRIGGTVTVGLPGNPVAVFVCFLFYVVPMLRRLGGAQWFEPRRFPLRAAFAFKGRKPGRREFWRGMLVDTPDGLQVEKFARDGSGLISGLRAADGIIEIPEAHGDVDVGDVVNFIPFSAFGVGH